MRYTHTAPAGKSRRARKPRRSTAYHVRHAAWDARHLARLEQAAETMRDVLGATGDLRLCPAIRDVEREAWWWRSRLNRHQAAARRGDHTNDRSE